MAKKDGKSKTDKGKNIPKEGPDEDEWGDKDEVEDEPTLLPV
jgi:hypothetical protein